MRTFLTKNGIQNVVFILAKCCSWAYKDKNQRKKWLVLSVGFLAFIKTQFFAKHKETQRSKVSVYLTGLSLVVGLVLYISNINDEMLNRTKSNEAYFSYNYGWSFAFAAISFLLTEVTSGHFFFF